MKMTSTDSGFVHVRPDDETPFKRNMALRLTEAEADGLRAFLRELKPGLYFKCSECGKFKRGLPRIFKRESELSKIGITLCDGCANA